MSRLVSARAPASIWKASLPGAALAGLKKRRFKRPEQQKWYAGETISVGIGQGYNAYAAATRPRHGDPRRWRGGVQPHLVRYVEDVRSGERRMIEPAPVTNLGLKPEHLARSAVR